MRLLITGSRGLVGYHAWQAAQRRALDVYLTGRGEAPPSASNYLSEDLTQPEGVRRLIEWARPDVVIHSAAMTLVDACQENPALCWLHNVTATRLLIEALIAYMPSTHFIFVSTDFVYDGFPAIERPYVEGDYEAPLSVYGASKLAAEAWVKNYPGPWAIARTALVYGWAPTLARDNILLRVIYNLKEGRVLPLYIDQVRTPSWAHDVGEGLILLAEKGAQGIFHIAGPDIETPYSFGLKVAQAWHLPAEKIQPITGEDYQPIAPRPSYSPLSIAKAQALGYNPHPVEEALKHIKIPS
ncbi:MAG: SDR family oxidoreductase [Bacteroidia bacterium]|nr:SDR family oxidoreductase [Bacteroidia bacterium]MDW8134664.1 SDR family oxidoreductase [Bacteroidia bacterium]